MIRIKDVTMSATRKINLGNFESVDVFTAVKAELTDGTTEELRTGIVELRKELITATQANMKAARDELGKEDIKVEGEKTEKPSNARSNVPHNR